MSCEFVLKKWLNSSNQCLAESIRFACGVCKTVEFPLQSKYDIVLTWVSKRIMHADSEKYDPKILIDLISLNYPQHLVLERTQKLFIKRIGKHLRKRIAISPEERIELFLLLTENKSYQHYYRRNPKSYLKLVDAIFSILSMHCESEKCSISSSLARFFGKTIDNLKSYAAHCENLHNSFKKKHLIGMILLSKLMCNGQRIYNDILDILKIIYFNNNALDTFLNHCMSLDLQTSLYCLDYAVNNCSTEKRGIENILRMFDNASKSEDEMLRYAHILELFHKYGVDINFRLTSSQEQVTGIEIIASYVEECAFKYEKKHFKIVLSLVCSALRLYPMCLEKSLLRIAAEFMLAYKSNDAWLPFVEFSMLMIDVFQKSGRSEKLVVYLMKSLRQQLQIQTLSNSLKRKPSKSDHHIQEKRKKKDAWFLETTADKSMSKFDPFTSSSEVSDELIQISMIWPDETVGKHFTAYTTCLMSKPSLVLWKTLVFSLTDSISAYRTDMSEKNIIMIELCSTLLCDYMAGSRLPEQTYKLHDDIKTTCQIMENALNVFGTMLLGCEHNNKTMGAFLNVCLSFGNLDCLTVYYRCEPHELVSPNLYKYLTEDQWTTLEQRVVNFGNNNIKTSLKQLQVQRIKILLLFAEIKKPAIARLSHVLEHHPDECSVMKAIFGDPCSFWLMEYLTKCEKQKLVQIFIGDDTQIEIKSIEHLLEDRALFEIVVYRILDSIKQCFNSKKSLIENVSNDTSAENIKRLLLSKSERNEMKECDTQRLKQILENIDEHLPIGCCSDELKRKIFSICLALYHQVFSTKCKLLPQLCLSLLSKLLHFGAPLDIFATIDLETFISVFAPSSFENLYESIFISPNIWNTTTEKCLVSFLNSFQAKKLNLTETDLISAIIIIQYMQHCSMKQLKKIMYKLIECIFHFIMSRFENLSNEIPNEEKALIMKTKLIPLLYLDRDAFEGNQEVQEYSDNIKRIYRMYMLILKNSDEYTKLIEGAIKYQKQLDFNENDINFACEEMLQKLFDDARQDVFDEQNAGQISKYLFNRQTAQKFVKMFNQVEALQNTEALKIAMNLSKCQSNAYMRMVLKFCVQKMIFNKVLQCEKLASTNPDEACTLLSILKLLESMCSVKKLGVSTKFIDDILAFLLDIKIEHYPVELVNQRELFYSVCKTMIHVCLALVHCQSAILSRIPTLMYLFINLLKALVSYRSSHLMFSSLDTDEIDNLAALGYDLEKLMHGMAKYPREMKRIAPYLLTQIIKISTKTNKSAVRYPKVKLHIDNICYELIALCDRRVGNFLLRISNDVTRQIYEELCKNYDKYRKYKGIV